MSTSGKEMHDLVKVLFPICRSITGNGVRETLKIISKHIPIRINEVSSGTKVFDWVIPKEWNIRDAFVEDENGDKIIEFSKNNLHIMGYSTPIDEWIDLSVLEEHLYSLPDQPNAIPYATSYYDEKWGFCICHNDRMKLKDGKYHVYIDSNLEDGALTYGEYIIPGETADEILLSTYICHPSMANNELSGPAVATFIANWLNSKPRRYTYRIIFIPETIGSITYLSKHSEELKHKVIAGFNISCIGDDGGYSYVRSPYENTYADRIVDYVLSTKYPDFIKYSYLDRGSDERQYCSPGIDLPLVTLCRSKFGTYPEYHTSLDNLDFVTAEGLYGGYNFVKNCLNAAENNDKYKTTIMCEPQLGKYGLYESGIKGSSEYTRKIKDFLTYCNGGNDLLWISEKINYSIEHLLPMIEKLKEKNIIKTLPIK